MNSSIVEINISDTEETSSFAQSITSPNKDQNHSTIVDRNHSTIVDREFSNVIVSAEETPSTVKCFGKFQSYPDGIFNPAFCGMLLWELTPNHILNEYKICQFHKIRSGIILYGCNAYIFTPITNNDIQSHLKILIRNKILKDNIPPSKASKKLVHYVRDKAKKHIIPCIPSIQNQINDLLGINDSLFVGDNGSYLTLLQRIYILIFMIRYQMPLQRKTQPGNRNLASSVYCFKAKGWYSHLSKLEQKILNNSKTVIANTFIPDDLVFGVSRSDIQNLTSASNADIQNTCMFRDGSMDSMKFQQQIQRYAHMHSLSKQHTQKKIDPTDTKKMKTSTCVLEEVPTIQFLQDCVHKYLSQVNVPDDILDQNISWNDQFHSLLDLVGLRDDFPPCDLPPCYRQHNSCGHVLQVDLHNIATNTLHLTTFEQTTNEYATLPSVNVASTFIYFVIFQNPLWDIGLQQQIVKQNKKKLHNNDRKGIDKYTSRCICPCSMLFHSWHEKTQIHKLPSFTNCGSGMFNTPESFVEHLYENQNDYYHRIILRMVQASYSSLIAKIKIPTASNKIKVSNKPFSSIHEGKVSLPAYVKSTSKYETFIVKPEGIPVTLCKTNILENCGNKEYKPYFSECSFQNTLKKLILCGEYNKTKKRSTPMYCYGSTITCTRFPKFFSDGRPQILPRPYITSKPGQKGSNLLNTSWMQSFLHEVEHHVLHYLHNFCSDKALKKITLLNIELSHKIIPQCLRLGGTCFTHMSVFGTVNKDDGRMPIHYDERDIISCVFHLGKVNSGGLTSYYSGTTPNSPGKKLYQVPFQHGTLQIGFFNKVLHGVDEWDGQRCGIQVNIKRDLLAHFIKYGKTHYDKYRLSGYPQGPIVYF